MIIPNVMHFEQPPPPPDDYTLDLRADLGLEPDEHLILQPTRVVQRKGIEHAIELVKRMGIKAQLVISHAAGDEGDAYEQRVREFAEMLGVKTHFVENIIRPQRGLTDDGRKVYTLADVYSQADLVTYPSSIEGFGNAFLEAAYFRRPLVVNNYSIYAIDIKPKGFRAIEFDGFVSDETVARAKNLLEEPGMVQEMTEHNYQLGKRHFSYRVLERRLSMLLGDYFGEQNQGW
jgi:glycosyltransferase involved in cell wall biosynthesis